MKFQATGPQPLSCTPTGPKKQTGSGMVNYETSSDFRRFYVAPRTPTEKLLAGIWTQVLDLEHIGIRDHFQDLGGRSLHATQILSRLKSDLGVHFPRSFILEAPTIELMATCIDAAYWTH